MKEGIKLFEVVGFVQTASDEDRAVNKFFPTENDANDWIAAESERLYEGPGDVDDPTGHLPASICVDVSEVTISADDAAGRLCEHLNDNHLILEDDDVDERPSRRLVCAARNFIG